MRTNPTTRLVLVVCVIWLAIFAAYSNSFSIAFQFDDTHTVQSNMAVRSLRNIPNYFVDATTFSYRPENSGYRPMATTAMAIGFWLSANETWGYHLIKLIEHCLVATLIFLLGLRFIPKKGLSENLQFLIAAFGAALFGVHRANTETVNYISAISSLQAGLFLLLGFYLYLISKDLQRQRDKTVAYGAGLLCFFASVLSKEEGITLPAVIFIYEWIYGTSAEESYVHSFRRNFWRALKQVAPFIGVAILFLLLRSSIQPDVADSSRGTTPTFQYAITQLRSWFFYWKLFFWPVDLNADNLAFDFSTGLGDFRVWLALAFHIAVLVFGFKIGKRYRFPLFALLWMYITILPASSVFRLVEAVNEHRMYIPYMFLSLLVVWTIVRGAKALAATGVRFAVIFLVLVVALNAFGTFQRNKVWATPVSLWEDVYAKNPTSPRAMNVLGISLMGQGDYDTARPLLEKCHQIAPQYLPCIVHLSMAYAQYRMYDKGLEVLQQGFKIDPNYIHINFHLGVYYKDFIGDLAQAPQYFVRVLKLSGGRFFQATLKLAEMEYSAGRFKPGIETAQSVLAVDGSNGDAWDVIGRGLILLGQFNDAIPIFERLAALGPGQLKPLLTLANLYERKGDFIRAKQYFQLAIDLVPPSVQAWQGFERIARALNDRNLLLRAQKELDILRATKGWVFLPALFMVGEKTAQVSPF